MVNNIQKFNILIFLFLLIINKVSQKETKSSKKNHNFCGVDYIKQNAFKTSIPSKYLNIKNNLSSKEYLPIRIFLDTTYLDKQIEELTDEYYNYLKEIYPIIKLALNKSVEAISQVLKVERYEDNIFINGFNKTKIKEQGIEIWDNKLNNLEEIHKNYDYILFAEFYTFDAQITAAGYPFILSENTNRPLLGNIQITYYIYNKENLEEYLKYIFLHELIHAFGFLEDSFKFFPGGNESIFTEIGVGGIQRTYVKTKKLLNFAKKYFGCDNIKGIELENQGLGGSKNNHWESRILLGELMTSEQYVEEGALSEFTLSFLEDTGWYQVNYYTGGLMRFGKNKGCDFLNKYCEKDNKTEFPNEYFDYNFTIIDHPSCTTGRLSRAYYKIREYDLSQDYDEYKNILPKIEDKYYGGYMVSADYCPISYKSLIEENEAYFVGNCKYGNGIYGLDINYKNIYTKENIKGFPNDLLPEEFGEIYSDHSFCYMNNLIPENLMYMYIYRIFGTSFHPICFPSFCSSKSLTIQIYNQYVVCPKQGGNIEVLGYEGKIHCPDYNLICTGTIMCNDIYDCIEKKSLLNENSLKYDYEPLTTQRYSDLDNIENIISYENGNDGICPINCIQCLENKKCRKCKKDFNLIGIKENDEFPIICDNNNINISIGYYYNKNDGVYYQCHNNCLKCSNGPVSDNIMNCIICKDGFNFNGTNNNCEKIEEEETNTILIVVSVVAGTLVVGAGTGTVIYRKKKKTKNGKIKLDIKADVNINSKEIALNILSESKNESNEDVKIN